MLPSGEVVPTPLAYLFRVQYQHLTQFLGGFYSSAPSDIDEARSPGFSAMAVDIVMRAFEKANIGVELVWGKYFRGTSSSVLRNDWVEMRAFVLPSGAYYVSWHVCPESGTYWPLVAVFDAEDEALAFVGTLADELIPGGMGFADLLRYEAHPAVLDCPWIMRGEGLLHLVRRGAIRFPTKGERFWAWLRRRPLPEFFVNSRTAQDVNSGR